LVTKDFCRPQSLWPHDFSAPGAIIRSSPSDGAVYKLIDRSAGPSGQASHSPFRVQTRETAPILNASSIRKRANSPTRPVSNSLLIFDSMVNIDHNSGWPVSGLSGLIENGGGLIGV
jgi:hypothetical protein